METISANYKIIYIYDIQTGKEKRDDIFDEIPMDPIVFIISNIYFQF